jgi:glycosyl-4,4'-diaponeurosporenoate acyltransferase
MSIALWTANLLGWPIIHLTTAFVVLRLPLEKFSCDSFIYKSLAWEREGIFYRQYFAIQRWKAMLPDGAPWVGGFSKKRLGRRDRAYLRTFLLETRRAEFAHWCMLACLPIFFLWNPLWACVVMTLYAVVANIPCILAQRYNRLILVKLLRMLDQKSLA